MLRSIFLCVAIASFGGCIYGKGRTGTNFPPRDQGGPWSQGESGQPALRDTGDRP